MGKTYKKDYQLVRLIFDIIIIAYLTMILIHLVNVKNGKSNYILYRPDLTNSIEDNSTEVKESVVGNFIKKYIYGNELLIFFSFIYILVVVSVISRNIGRFGAKIHYAYYRHYLKKNNPYQYYRELPNNFGVAIASLIVDSALENKKDIVAVILDLCAKGYLELEKDFNGNYSIRILNNDINKLLPNEQYVIRSITNGKIRSLNYEQWYKYCKDDAIRLGLITEDIGISSKKRRKKSFLGRLYKISACLGTIVAFFLYEAQKTELIQAGENADTFIILQIFSSILVGGLMAILVVIAVWPFYTVINTIRNSAQRGYRKEKGRNLNLTEYGKAEVKKLFAFESFLKDFGLFASKNPEEITLWEYYLSYAQVFGLTDEILKTGYKEIIKRGSIQLEDINTISIEKFMN